MPSPRRSGSGSRRAFAEPTAAQAQAWPAIATGEHTLISAPTGSGKTLAAFLWGLDRLVAEPSGRPHADRLRVAAEGALLRRREEPARAAARDRRRRPRRGAHRRHAAEGPARHDAPPAGHPDHHARVAVPDAHEPGARDLRRRRGRDPRRDPRGRADQARRAHGAHARAARARGRRARAADRPVRHPEPARGGRPLHGRPEADVPRGRRRRAQAAGPQDPRAGREHGRARAVRRRSSTRSPAPRRRASRSGRRSTPRSSSSSARTPRRSCSSTTAAAPSGSRCGSTSSPPTRTRTARRSRSPAPTTARWRARSGS